VQEQTLVFYGSTNVRARQSSISNPRQGHPDGKASADGFWRPFVQNLPRGNPSPIEAPARLATLPRPPPRFRLGSRAAGTLQQFGRVPADLPGITTRTGGGPAAEDRVQVFAVLPRVDPGRGRFGHRGVSFAASSPQRVGQALPSPVWKLIHREKSHTTRLRHRLTQIPRRSPHDTAGHGFRCPTLPSVAFYPCKQRSICVFI
jgi:hypothetical protein